MKNRVEQLQDQKLQQLHGFENWLVKSVTEVTRCGCHYLSEGGYTPGDAYDIYFNEDYMIKEWTFRKGNSDRTYL